MTICNPWTIGGSPANQWRVHGITQRRITEATVLRHTEQGQVRIVQRGAGTPPWTAHPIPSQPPSPWHVAGWNYRRLEDGCLRHTEDGEIRLVE
jgi:hypothetical protein